MKIKIVVNKPYEAAVGDFVKSIPYRNERLGEVIYAGRNTISHINVAGIDLSIKSFKVPMFINRVAYTFLRKSKARRSYEHALALQQMGFDTPDPVAYIETYRHGLLYRSYYVCLMLTNAQNIRQWEERPDCDRIVDGTAQLMVKLHRAGIFHRDFTPGNILYDPDYRFYLIDINRMKIGGNIGMKTMLKNFNGINENFDALRALALRYAEIAGIAASSQFASQVVEESRKWWSKRHKRIDRKQRLKERLKKSQQPNPK